MKRLAALAVLFSIAMFAQETKAPEGKSESSGKAESGNLQLWKWANFLVLAGGIGYLAGKNAGPFFSARSRQIRKDIIEADEARSEAQARADAVDLRLANLEAEIAALRRDAQMEAQAETERQAQHTAAEIAKLQHHSEQEITAAGKAARLELKGYAAQLAIGLAERKLHDRMTPGAQDAMVRGFVRHLQ
ncbi:MAG TPA: ATP synthase F0 subunit B [Bryobacteraceae bacterium]|nr:ATP synthase F0 subunit B [Bryobacteraceae bacterium]